MVGTTAGPTLQVLRVGEAKNEGHIPDGWFDDPYEGDGDLWAGQNSYTKLPDGRGFYKKIIPYRVDAQNNPDDLTLIPPWTVGTKYEKDDSVTLSESHDVGNNNIFEFFQVYICREEEPHTATVANGPATNALRFWILDRTLHTSLTQDGPDTEAVFDENIGITPRTIIHMNDHEPVSSTPEGRADEPGEYKFGDKSKGVWESYVDMESIWMRTEIISLNLVDRLGNSNFSFYSSLGRAKNIKVVWRLSDGKWIRWLVRRVSFSNNLRRAGIVVVYDAHNFTDNDDDVPTDIHVPVDFVFDLARPNIVDL